MIVHFSHGIYKPEEPQPWVVRCWIFNNVFLFFSGGEHSHSHDSHMDDTHQHDNFGNDHSHAHSLKDLSIGLSVLGKWKILLYLSIRIEWLLSLTDICSICKILLTFTLARVRASKTHFGNCQVRNYNGCRENSRIFKNRELSLSFLWEKIIV